MLAAGAVLFFAYAGYDVVAMATEEVREHAAPQSGPPALLPGMSYPECLPKSLPCSPSVG